MSYLNQHEANYNGNVISSKSLLVKLKHLEYIGDLCNFYFCIEECVKIAYFGANKNLWNCDELQDALISELQKMDEEGKYPELKELENHRNSVCDPELNRAWQVEGIWGAVANICGVSKYDDEDCCEGSIIEGKEEKYKELRVFVSEAKRSFLNRLILKVETDIIKSELNMRV